MTDASIKERCYAANAKLTKELAKVIREEFASNRFLRVQDLADKYEVSRGDIQLLLNGHIWKTAGGPTGIGKTRRLITKEQKDLVCKMVLQGSLKIAAAKAAGVHPHTVRVILKERRIPC